MVNCRCTISQRAKWRLDEKELTRFKERAEYYGIDKAKNFDEFKSKYLKTVDKLDNKIKKIELSPEADKIKGMSNDTKRAICNAFDKIKEE